jgi:2-oxoglutarate dehydrogenase E2 component (dihydrolipoamide succinyltransferase)
VDINVAVSTDRGLLTPLVKDCDKIGLTSINSAVKDLAEKGKNNKLSPAELAVSSY